MKRTTRAPAKKLCARCLVKKPTRKFRERADGGVKDVCARCDDDLEKIWADEQRKARGEAPKPNRLGILA